MKINEINARVDSSKNFFRCYWFSVSPHEGNHTNLREYNLIGVLMGLAVYNSIILVSLFIRLKVLLSEIMEGRLHNQHGNEPY